MKLVILRSVETGEGPQDDDPYNQEFDTLYADRVIRNLVSEPGFCSACGPDCTNCRKTYDRRYNDEIAAIRDFPSVLPYVLEQPADHVPDDIPEHDVLLAICIHEQILLECLKRAGEWGTRAILVPLESDDWISGSAISQARGICEANGVEIAFPKPFCAFRPAKGSFLDEFMDQFHIGFPKVEISVSDDGIIENVQVNVSAACGATYCVARWLADRSIDDNIEIEVIGKRLHSFPCTASMEYDDELGDTPLHIAGLAHYSMLNPHRKVVEEDSGFVKSPIGRMIQTPAPPREYLGKIEKARAVILDELRESGEVDLGVLRRNRELVPAAVNSALVTLAKERKIGRVGLNRICKGEKFER